MSGSVPRRWLDCRGVWATPGEAVREYGRVPGCRLSSHCLPSDQIPSEGRGEAVAAPEPIKALMDFDSDFFMRPQPAGPASGEIGCLLLPIKAHKLYPQINGISVLGECVCAYVAERSEETGLKSERGKGLAARETVLVTGPKALDVFPQLLHQLRQQSNPSGEHIRKTIPWHQASS